MNQGYKPHAYPSVSAYVMANNAQRVIDFVRQTFDAEEGCVRTQNQNWSMDGRSGILLLL